MNVLPVIVRELRVGARQPANYGMRMLGAAFVVFVFLVIMLNETGDQATLGAKLFTRLHTTIFVAIWLLVPAMTADCLAREKREGTLGLLFLTPLTPAGIVVGKSLVHLLKALTLWLAALPVMTVSLLLGGLTWLDIYSAFMLELCAVILALSAGIYASVFSKVRGRAMVSAVILGFGLAMLLGGSLLFGTAIKIIPLVRNVRWQELLTLQYLVGGSLILCTGIVAGNWSELFAGFPPAARQIWVGELSVLFLFSLLVLGLVVWLAAHRVKRSWQEEPPSARKLWWLQIFTVPILWRARLRRNTRRALDRNPIAWLHQCSWSARLTKWGWCLGFVGVECLPLGLWTDFSGILEAFWMVQSLLMLVLALALAFVAAGSFIKEKENGVLELLLVSPLPLRQLIFGRVLGLWQQFLPSALMIVLASALWLVGFSGGVSYGASSDTRDHLQSALVFMICFITLPFVGLYWSLRLKRQWVAWLLTGVMGGFLPLAFGIPLGDLLADFLAGQPVSQFARSTLMVNAAAASICLSQISFAALACFLLRHSLSRRIYPFA